MIYIKWNLYWSKQWHLCWSMQYWLQLYFKHLTLLTPLTVRKHDPKIIESNRIIDILSTSALHNISNQHLGWKCLVAVSTIFCHLKAQWLITHIFERLQWPSKHTHARFTSRDVSFKQQGELVLRAAQSGCTNRAWHIQDLTCTGHSSYGRVHNQNAWWNI